MTTSPWSGMPKLCFPSQSTCVAVEFGAMGHVRGDAGNWQFVIFIGKLKKCSAMDGVTASAAAREIN